MFKHQPGHISIMNTGFEIKLTDILDLHVPLTLSVTIISVRSDRLHVEKYSRRLFGNLYAAGFPWKPILRTRCNGKRIAL